MKNLVLGLDPAIATLGFALIERAAVGEPEILDMGVWTTPAKAAIPARLRELLGDYGAYLRQVDERIGRVQTIVAETPSFLPDASASTKLWTSFALLLGMSAGRLFVERSTTEWRTSLGLEQVQAEKVTLVGCKGSAPGCSKKTPCPACKVVRRAKYNANDAAKAVRKADNAECMSVRYGDHAIDRALATTEDDKRQHAIDALCIATSWHDDCRKHAAQPTQEA